MKKYRVDEQDLRTCYEKALALLEGKPMPSKLEITTNPTVKLKDEEKIKLVFSVEAEKKMNYLIDECKKEIGWHGLVERTDEGFLVTDIIVFPQEVTSSTVVTDDVKYPEWLMSQPDEVFNKIRFHGHSHVRMATSPSAVDTTYQESLIQQQDDFYIFGIFNKQGDYWLHIYDIANNRVYDNDDIEYWNYEDIEKSWAKEQIEKYLVEKKTYSGYTGYKGGHYWTNKKDEKDYSKKNTSDKKVETKTSKEEDKEKDKEEDYEYDTNYVTSKVLLQLTPPTYGKRWSTPLQRYIYANEEIEDLVQEYLLTRAAWYDYD